MKKLLMIGCNAGTESMPKYFREQCEYREIKLDKDLTRNIREVAQSSYIPDIVFLQIQADQIDGISTEAMIGQQVRQLKDKGAFVVNWTGDMRNSTPRWMIDFSKNVNLTMFSNYRDVEYCKARNIPTGFLQQGIDHIIFNPIGEAADVPDIVFLANNYGNQFPLSGYRKSVIQTLRAKYGNRFKVYGNGWGADSGNVNSSQYEEAKVYRGCKIAISVSHYDSDGYFSDRLGRALCSEAFVLSHNYQGIERDFLAGKHLDVFDNLDRLIFQCERYIDNSYTRQMIAKEGREYAVKNFSYKSIVKQILELG